MSDPETRFKLTLHYDGGAFRGWQVQPGKPTVQGAIQNAVSRLTGEHRTVVGSGRTDTGVHATGQIAAVTMPARWTARELARSLNALLPGTIWVRDIEAVPESFHPRIEAVARTYEYRIGTAPGAASPFHRRWCWPLCRALDLDAATRAAHLLPGEHEFRAFAKSGQPQRGYVCRVSSARWRRWNDRSAVFAITANRFLHRMVRYLVGTMVDIALGRRKEEEMALLLNGDAELVTSRPAPPSGLFLTRVEYDHDVLQADETREFELSLDWATGGGTRDRRLRGQKSSTETIVTDKLIDRNPDILGGTPVFSGTRVPVRILMEHLEAGDRLDEFLHDYPTVTREQAVELLARATTALVGDESVA